MRDPWKAGTRVVSPSVAPASVTLVLDDVTEAQQLLALLADVDLSQVEIRASFAGPSRASSDVLPEILIVVQQLGIGAAGSGIWFGVQSAVQRVVQWRRDQKPERATAEQSILIMVPTDRGPALVQRISIGPHDLDAELASFERVVQSLLGSADADS